MATGVRVGTGPGGMGAPLAGMIVGIALAGTDAELLGIGVELAGAGGTLAGAGGTLAGAGVG